MTNRELHVATAMAFNTTKEELVDKVLPRWVGRLKYEKTLYDDHTKVGVGIAFDRKRNRYWVSLVTA